MTTRKTKAPAVDAARALKRSQLHKQFPSMSTTGQAQMERILEALQRRPHSSYELRRLGCYQCPTRVHALRQAGHPIFTSRITLVDQDGYSHKGVALYSLLGRPEDAEATPVPGINKKRPGGPVIAGVAA